MNLTMTVEGSLQVRQTLRELGKEATPALRKALYEEGNELINEADKLVPRDTANLAQSKFVTIGTGEPEVIVGYGGAAAPYAVVVHENPRSGITGGVSPQGKPYKHWAAVGQWKYLEQPFKERISGFTSRIAESLRRSLLKGK